MKRPATPAGIWNGVRSLVFVLAWAYFVFAVALLVIAFFVPDPQKLKPVFFFAFPAYAAIPFGAFWAIYQCLQFEKRPWRYLPVVLFIPLGFVWYYFRRYRVRGQISWREQEADDK
jgi:hypothetical protein